jgi:hypothetical protein
MRALLVVAALSGVAVADDAPKGYAPYPKSRELCNEHVSGNTMHIIWSSHATVETLTRVVAHYEKALGKKATDDANGGKMIDVDGNRHVTIYPAGKNDKYPSCSKKPKAGEATVVMLSNAIR